MASFGQAKRHDEMLGCLHVNIWMIIGIVVSWLAFMLLFVLGILLIVGTLGNEHEEVIRFMNCDKPNSAVSCARVYGFRAEGVALIIISFFALAWAVIFTIVYLIGKFRKRSAPRQQGGLTLSSRTHTAQFATSEA